MKNFLCFLLIVGIMLVSGCQNPLQGIDDVQTRIEGIKTSSEQQVTAEEDVREVSKNNDDENKDNSNKFLENKTNAQDKTNIKKDVKLQIEKDTKNSSSTDKTTDETLSVTAYYRDEEGTLIPVTRDIDKEEGVAKAAIKSMIDNEANREGLKPLGLYPIIPEGTEILGVDIKDGIAVIDFNSKLLEYKTELEERNIFAGIVYSLTEFKTITGVRILINGYVKEKLKYSGDISGNLRRNNILINSTKLNSDNKTMKLDVYLFKYLDDKQEYLLPVSMEYIGINDDMLPVQIVRALSKQPEDDSLYTQMPENVELVDCDIEDKVVTLDFNKEIKKYGGNAREEGLLKQILYTMKQIDGVERVKILIEGKKDDLPEGTDLSKDLILPSKINKVTEKDE